MGLFLEGVDIDGIGKLVKNYVYTQMQDFFGGNAGYINSCIIHAGFMTDKSAAGLSGNQRDHFLFAGNGAAIEEPEKELFDMETFQTVMLERLEKYMGDSEQSHFTIGFQHYQGNGYGQVLSDFADDGVQAEPVLANHNIVWCIYAVGPEGSHPVSELTRQVLLTFLRQCFRDSQQIRWLMRGNDSERCLSQLAEKANIKPVATYLEAVASTYRINLEDFNKISVAPQEKRECRGKMLFIDDINKFKERQDCKTAIFEPAEEFQKRKLSNIQGTRKLLEACEENYLLVDRNSNDLVGISKQTDDTYGFISVQFHGMANWELKVHGETVLVYDRCTYFAEHVLDLTSESSTSEYAYIKGFGNIIEAAKEARHGALVIITADAAEEVKRLAKANRAIKVRPFGIDSEDGKKLFAGMMNVDGAVLVSFKGTCEGFGVILDGIAVARGMEEKGSRYNSAMNYIGGKYRIAIVASEDQSKGIVVKHGKEVELLEL